MKKPGATIIPVIISSDKTQIMTFGGKSAYPVYLTIGNLPKEIRRKPSRRGQILLAYLPTTRLEHISNKSARRRMVLNVMHRCMREILSPLRAAGKDGISMASGDGAICRTHPIYAAHVGDYIEQIAVVGCKMMECPQCTVPPDELGEPGDYPHRDLEQILEALHQFDSNPANFFQACREAGIKPIAEPFWDGLPFSNVFLSITPDILHQLLQSMVKHLCTWIKKAYPSHELDARCQALPRNSHIRHFFQGITPLSKITGKEHNDIARILLGLIIDLPLPNGISNARLLAATRALLDFLFLAQYPVHSDATLHQLEDVLQRFHDNKDIFITLGIRTDFNLPKLHFLSHYVQLIKWLGTPDNFDTEYSERLHIDFAKDAYQATNHKNELLQMTLWLERKEKILQFSDYIAWRLEGSPSLSAALPDGYPTTRISMTKHPSRPNVSFEDLTSKYGATYIRDALARYIAAHNNSDATHNQIELDAADINFPVRGLPVYHKAKFWLGHSEHHPLSSNKYDTVHAKSGRLNTLQQDIPGQFDPILVSDGKTKEASIEGK